MSDREIPVYPHTNDRIESGYDGRREQARPKVEQPRGPDISLSNRTLRLAEMRQALRGIIHEVEEAGSRIAGVGPIAVAGTVQPVAENHLLASLDYELDEMENAIRRLKAATNFLNEMQS